MNTGEQLGAAIRAAAFSQRAAADEWVRTSGLTRQQALALGYIEDHQGKGVIARDIAAASNTTAASVTSLLKGLEDRGLIARHTSPADSRLKLLTLTPAGSALIDGFNEAMSRAEQEFFAPLSPAEQHQLLALLERLTEGN